MLKRLFDISLPSLLSAVLVVAACHHEPPGPDGGTNTDMTAETDMAVPPVDLAPCNPADPACPQPDMAKPPGDMAHPPGDMANPPTDMVTPPTDMVTPPADMTKPPTDMITPPADMTTPPTDMPKPTDMITPPADMSTPADMTTPPTDGGTGMAGIGDPCTADGDCKVGASPTCWKSNVLNNTANPATTGGYCSAKCTADADCGSGNKCIAFGPTDKYCLKGCADATTCRHPGYACAFIGSGVCYPDSIYDCDPTAGTGTCTEAGSGKAGGCLRQAYENKGVCQASCTIGAGTCADLGGRKRQCIYYDMTRDGFSDTYKGLICAQQVASPKATGAMCSYLNECVDGDECDPIDGTCHVMCGKSGSPACAMGTCQDDLMSPSGSAGLCR